MNKQNEANGTASEPIVRYDELVKRLKDIAQSDGNIKSNYIGLSLLQAADAIEELSAYVRQIEELRKEGYYLQKTKMMTYGQATMTGPLPEPPKENEKDG